MKRLKILKIGIFFLSFLLSVSIALAGGLPDEWTEINPVGFEFNGLTPACSNAPGTTDDEFSFFVKGGKKNNIVVFFQGGGACWDYINCVAAPTYTQQQQEVLEMFSDDMEGYGLFDQTEKENPFKDWGFVYIPYCTGDLFWGANDANYYGTTIKHRGFVNFQAVLNYLENNTHYPRKIFVTGSSAGSYGATLAFPYIKQAFKWSRVYLLGDAGAGVLGGTFPTEGILNWNVQLPDWIFPDGYNSSLTMPVVYSAIAAEYPWMKLAQYTTAFDGTQTFFYNVMLNIDNPYVWDDISPEVAATWHFTMLDYAYNTAAASPNYRYYIGAGTVHTIMMSPKFYSEESAGGIPFYEWVRSMVRNPFGTHSHYWEGKWKNVECEDCLP